MAPIPEGSAEKERMMALQLPEPKYYPLAEVAKRWGVSGDYLVRIGIEQQIKMGVRVYRLANELCPGNPIDMNVLSIYKLASIERNTRFLRDHPQMVRTYTETTYDDLVIPTTEIHRIERKQEKTDQAIAKAEAESPIPSQSKRALNTRAKVIGALVKSHNINLADKGATSALITKLELQGVALARDTVKTILDEAREQIEKPN
jgi:hypothetical protein